MPTGLQLLSLYLLMYADDMVLFSESNSEPQNMLKTVQNYTTEWSLGVNEQKPKVVVFRNGGKRSYSGENVEIVDKFVYLGVV